MTEKEAWLELAKIYEPGKPVPGSDWFVRYGICHGIEYLQGGLDNVSGEMASDMRQRLEIFRPLDPDTETGGYYWGDRGSRQPRATACGFLAAMCND